MEILENKNNLVIMEDEAELLQFFSYNKHIATYDKFNKKLYLGFLWNYSQTTLKQLKNFINNYTCFYYDNKKQFELEIKNNKNIFLK